MPGHTDNDIVIAAPPDLTWEVANDLKRWPDLFQGEYAAVEILEQEPDRVRFRLTTVPGPDGVARSWTSERCLDRERRTVTARRVEPGPFHYMHIFQSVTPVPEGSRLRWVQDFEVRADAPFGEAWFTDRVERMSRANLLRHKHVVEALAREV
jgi:aromatase